MNWKEFKEVVEAAGVTDEMEVEFIDVSSYPVLMEDVSVDLEEKVFSITS